MTYSEMVTGVTSMASALRKRGLGVGDIVLLMAPNFIEVALTFLGVWKAGGVCACLTLNLFAGNSVVCYRRYFLYLLLTTSYVLIRSILQRI